jgi:hypothetical protein
MARSGDRAKTKGESLGDQATVTVPQLRPPVPARWAGGCHTSLIEHHGDVVIGTDYGSSS